MSDSVKFIPLKVRSTSEIVFHHDNAPGLRYVALEKSLLPNSPIYIAVRRASDVNPSQADYIDSHVHSVDSVYVFLGDDEDLGGLHALIRTNDGVKEVESPITVFIPRGTPHNYRLTKGSGIYISLVMAGDYDAHTAEYKKSHKK